ncbi:seminal metalloprotease 1 [Helicoverpa armigera]|uniref:seminal metalloprotease 1 n=1 Tax=Helicoverpa armigera TaxID=29058 RepID=UPI00308357DA
MWSAIVVLSLVGCAVAGPPVTRSRKDIEAFRAYLERSRTDDGLRLESRMLLNPKASPWENSGKFQGDILLNDKQAELLMQQYAGVGARNAFIWPNKKWPRNTVVYEINNEFTQAQVQAIRASMAEIEEHTCIRFRRKTRFDRNYVLVTGRPGCYATLGYWEDMGMHTMNIGKANPGEGCFINAIIIHEWLHIIGFEHLHSTHDRDNYVHILWENMVPDGHYNFEKFDTDTVDNMDVPYEYASTMHYDRYGSTANGKPTMLPIYNDYGRMGQVDYVTAWDWLRVNRHYNCPGAWETPVHADELSQKRENDAALEKMKQVYVVEDLPQEEVLAADTPQGVEAEKVSVVEEARLDQ